MTIEAYKLESGEIDSILRGYLKEKEISHLDFIKLILQHVAISSCFLQNIEEARELFEKFGNEVVQEKPFMKKAFLNFFNSIRAREEYDEFIGKQLKEKGIKTIREI